MKSRWYLPEKIKLKNCLLRSRLNRPTATQHLLYRRPGKVTTFPALLTSHTNNCFGFTIIPIFFVITLLQKFPKATITSIFSRLSQPMLNRIIMNVIKMFRPIILITYYMIPIPGLPDITLLQLRFLLSKATCKRRFNHLPAYRMITIFSHSPETVQVIR